MFAGQTLKKGVFKMSRGLSELQKNILQLACTNGGSILARNVLAEVYGFPAAVTNIMGKRAGALVFSRKVIGEKRYQSASVSVAKAFNRLAARGLAHRKYNKGITLTKKRIEVASRNLTYIEPKFHKTH
jgi:hypothetical protein